MLQSIDHAIIRLIFKNGGLRCTCLNVRIPQLPRVFVAFLSRFYRVCPARSVPLPRIYLMSTPPAHAKKLSTTKVVVYEPFLRYILRYKSALAPNFKLVRLALLN